MGTVDCLHQEFTPDFLLNDDQIVVCTLEI
jgi:hypothetical protein